uniref:Uncharacterized protein n=1 Tax=Aegilops tauschii TaxID=37682 RepID=N1QQF7_AEGTA
MPDRKLGSVDDDQKILEEAEEPTPPQTETYEQDDNAFQGMIRASKEEYDKLPPYMKTLASWEWQQVTAQSV